MIYLIPNILSKEECDYLSKKFDKERMFKTSGDKKTHTNNTFGYGFSYDFDKYMQILKPKVLEFCDNIDEINNVNTYVREYINNSFLQKHIDRKDISITMSICLESTINKEWPLCAEIDDKHYCFNTNVGDGILLFDADKTVHWRDALICNKKERVLQFFLHWMPINYINKTKKSLI